MRVRCQCTVCMTQGDLRPKLADVLVKDFINQGKNAYLLKVKFLVCKHERVFMSITEAELKHIIVEG